MEKVILRIVLLYIFLGTSCHSEKFPFHILEIRENGIVANYLSTPENEENPIVVIFPGSESPLVQTVDLVGLINNGYDVLSIAYFGMKGLPDQIEEIPLEYFHQAIRWLDKSENRKNRKIVVLGISRGAEAALFYSSIFTDLDGLILYSPGCLSLPTHVTVKKDQLPKASWTFEGKDIPTVALDPFNTPAGEVVYKDYIAPFIGSEEVMKPAMPDMEKINCPVLMLSGKQDYFWPAFAMATVIENLLYHHLPDRTLYNITFAGAGHHFFWFGEGEPEKVETSQTLRLTGFKRHQFMFGGSEEETKAAMAASKNEVFRFLEEIKSR